MRPPLTAEAVASTRARLTGVATNLFLREGVEALSIRKLAAAAGMSRSTPYGYFKTKRELVDSIRAEGFNRMTARCRIAIESAPDPLSRMRELGHAVVRFACEEPQIYALMFAAPVFSPDVSDILAEAVSRFRAVSRPPLDEALGLGLVHGNPDSLRRATWAAFHGLVSLQLQGHLDRAQLEADFEVLNEIIGFGILTPSARAELTREANNGATLT